MSDTTELNRAIAKELGQDTLIGNYGRFYWLDSGGEELYDGSAWADSADVALRELWDDLDLRQQGDAWALWWLHETAATFAIAICRAWLAMKGVEVE